LTAELDSKIFFLSMKVWIRKVAEFSNGQIFMLKVL